MEPVEHVKSICTPRPARTTEKVDVQSLFIREGDPRGGNTVTLVVGEDFYASTSLYATWGTSQWVASSSGGGMEISYPTAE